MSDNENESTKSNEKEKVPVGLGVLLRYVGDEENAYTPIIRLNSLVKEKSVAPKVFLLPGIEGMASVLEPLAANLTSHAICLQFVFGDDPKSTIEDLARSLLPVSNISRPLQMLFWTICSKYVKI